ncbi:MAG: lysylphosphatidylglycerol synthase domain-containing protein [Kiloniellales bacterium]
MNRTSTIGMLLGLAAVTALVAWQGVATVGGALASIGWGMLLFIVIYLPHLVLGTISWRLLFDAGRAPRIGPAIYAVWIGGSVNWLLPVASIGGELVKARLVMNRGVRETDAGASIVVDKTVQALSIVLWVLIGLCLLVWLKPDPPLMVGVFLGLVLFTGTLFIFLAIQRAGAFGFLSGTIARLSGSAFWHRVAGKADQMDATIRALYDRPVRITCSVLLRLGARLALAGEVWLAAYLMGAPIGVVEAVMLKSLAAGARSAAFTIPGGLGAQEAGFMVFGALVGLTPELMLSISLATRVRELMIGLPGLIAWQLIEGRALATRGRAGPSSD